MSGEKTEQPTDKKLDDARKKGQLPQRKNVLEAFLILMGVWITVGQWSTVAGYLNNTIDSAISGINKEFDEAMISTLAAGFDAIRFAVIVSLVLGFGVLFLNLLFNKFNFAPAALTPKFEKLNPVNGLKGIFSKNTLYNFGRLMIYFPAVSIIVFFVIKGNISNALNAAACGLTCLAELFPGILFQMVILILLVLFILAWADFKLQTKIFISQNKMTKDDIKREHKGSEGDPQIKGKRSQLAQEDIHLPSPKEVTHVVYSNSFLVALLYHPGSTPFIVMKVQGDNVMKVQAKFRQMGVRCVNLPAVAKQFFTRYAISTYADINSADGMQSILTSTGEI